MKKYYKFINIILISLACEIFLFNYNFFTTLFNKEIVYLNDNPSNVFEIEDINRDVNNIKIEVDSKYYIPLKIFAVDEGNSNYYLLNQKQVYSNNKKSLYQNIHPAGKIEKLKFDIIDVTTHISKVIINAKVPLMFSIVRFLIILFAVFLIYIFNSNSKLYKIKLFELKANKLIICEMVIFLSIFLGALCVNNDHFKNIYTLNQLQYNVLTNSIREGRIYIEEATDETLLNMNNPYDTVERFKMAALHGTKYFWDYSLFNGKYYVYFGIGPVLLTYLPFNLLTGKDLSNVFVNFLFLILSIFSSTYLIYNICKKWFKDIKLLTFLMCNVLFVTSCGIFFVSKRPDFYNVPIITSIFFVTFGLGLFISASTSKKLFKTKLVIASCSMAFVALCRPQFLISTFFIIPIYYDYFFKKFDKQKFKELLCILIPYIVFAILTCTYNYIRYGSILDFGANYNLTTNDMTKRGIVFARIPLGIFYYLLVPTRFIPSFPFIESIPALTNNYFGKTIYENTYGGFFFTHAITLISLFVMKFKEYFKDKKLYLFTILSIIFAFIVIIVDTEMAGILPRYYMDFSYLLLIPTIIILFTLEKKILDNKLLKKAFIILIAVAVIYEFMLLFVDEAPSIKDTMPNIYYYFKYLFTL